MSIWSILWLFYLSPQFLYPPQRRFQFQHGLLVHFSVYLRLLQCLLASLILLQFPNDDLLLFLLIEDNALFVLVSRSEFKFVFKRGGLLHLLGLLYVDDGRFVDLIELCVYVPVSVIFCLLVSAEIEPWTLRSNHRLSIIVLLIEH